MTWPQTRPTLLAPVDSADIAAALEVSANTVKGWRRRRHLPPPDAVLGGTPVWEQRTIDRWVADGRPSQE